MIKRFKKWLNRNKCTVQQMTFGRGNEKKIRDLRRYRKDYTPVDKLITADNATMIITTVNLPPYMVEWLNDKSEKGVYASRSEALRLAVREFMRNDDEFLEFLEKKYGKKIKFEDKEHNIIGEA